MRLSTKRRLKWVILTGVITLACLILLLVVLANRYVEPVLKQRLHTMIIEGSDSLYTYKLGDLQASFFGGNVEIDDLQVSVDSAKYRQLEAANALPSLTFDIDMKHGHIHGLSVLPLIFGKRISMGELRSENANIRLTRQTKSQTKNTNLSEQPFWRSIQPVISRINIDEVNLVGMKLLYKSADTAESMKLQFDTCHAELRNIRIDSVGAFDTSRIGFARDVHLVFRDLKFRTADSASKMKAESFEYSSDTRRLEITHFKIQPTIKDKSEYYQSINRKEGMSVIEFARGVFTEFRLEKYLRENFVVADSVIIEAPVISSYTDKTFAPFMTSKVGRYPHQQMLKANSYIFIKGAAIRNAKITYTEKAEKTGQEGTIGLSDVNITVSNITNDPNYIKRQPKTVAFMEGKILGNSPFKIDFLFHLDSAEGEFEAKGWIRNVSASVLNPVAVPLANTRLQSFNMHELNFNIKGDDYWAAGEVRMRYNDLYVVLQKTDKETGLTTTNNFFTKLMNKYVLHDRNPGPDGVERVARNVRRSRQSYQAFTGHLWKTIFTGMQDVMIRSGSFE